MIKTIKIKNFKSIKSADVDVSNLNLLMGLNGTGKSTLVQALLLLMQSDRLEKGMVDLNGTLVQIGQGRDALYQYAEDEQIIFDITIKGHPRFTWRFGYHKDKEKLTAENDYTRNQMSFFRQNTNRFQYIRADRIGPKDIYDASSVVAADKKQLGLLR